MGEAVRSNGGAPAEIERLIFNRADELALILAQLREALLRLEVDVIGAAVGDQSGPRTAPAAYIRQYLAEARLRKKIFSSEVAYGPSWRLLANLYEAHLAQRRESVGGIGLLADVAPATTVRCVRLLQANGFVRLRADPLDSRRKWVELTAEALELLGDFFARVAALKPAQ